MIEPTDEMVAAFERAVDFAASDEVTIHRRAYRAGLAAVLALVERDYPATEYTVCDLPEDDINHSAFAVKVAYRGRGLWAVTRHRYCLSRTGEWHYESMPSERTDEWLTEHRFYRDEALRLAREAAPTVRVNGMTVADLKAWIEQRRNPQ